MSIRTCPTTRTWAAQGTWDRSSSTALAGSSKWSHRPVRLRCCPVFAVLVPMGAGSPNMGSGVRIGAVFGSSCSNRGVKGLRSTKRLEPQVPSA